MEVAERWLSLLVTCLVALVMFLGFAAVKVYAHDPTEFKVEKGKLMYRTKQSARATKEARKKYKFERE